MPSTPTIRSRAVWAGLSLVEWAALGILVLFGALWGLHQYSARIPVSGFLALLAAIAAMYWLVRGWKWARAYLLWSLRNRLVTAYIFIAVVPVLLLLAMAGLAAYLLYWQLGSYVLYTQMQDRVNRLGGVTGTMVTSYAVEAVSGHKAASLAVPS